MIHTNKELALKLETAEFLNQLEFVLSHNRLFKDSQARYQKIGSSYAIFAGVDSPLTQIFGMALDGDASVEQIIELEEFFKQHKAPVNIEVCHLSDLNLSRMLIERGYQIIEYSNVLLRQINPEDQFEVSADHNIRKVTTNEIDEVGVVVIKGFLKTKRFRIPLKKSFKPVWLNQIAQYLQHLRRKGLWGGGSVFLMDDIALLGGASTLPAFRKQGIQTDLLKARLAYAQGQGCHWSMVTTEPGSISQKNVERLGFQVIYARTKFIKEW